MCGSRDSARKNCVEMYTHCPVLYCAASDVWVDKPTQNGVIIYSLITPILALFGFIGNLLSFITLTHFYPYSSSTSTYLAVLALTDLAASVFLFVSGLCRGVLWSMAGWRDYEAIIAIPIGGVFTCWASTAIVAVTFDRIIYLWCPIRPRRPALGEQKKARLVMLGGLLVSILFNLPYCFMYTWDCAGNLATTEFVKTTYYTIHTWTRLMLFSILPALLLLLGNIYLIRSLKKVYKISDECRLRCNKASKAREQKWLTVTLVAMIFFFLVGEIPANVLSRSSVVTLLFKGNEAQADSSKALEFCRQLATLMNGIYLSLNFFIYYMFCTKFRKSFCDFVKCRPCRRGEANAAQRKTIAGGNEQDDKGVQLKSVNICVEGKRAYWVPVAESNWRLVKLLEENKFTVNVITAVKIY